MIRVTISLDREHILKGVEAHGHSTAGMRGTNIVCAAVTALIRTAARLLEERGTGRVSGAATSPGNLGFTLSAVDSGMKEYVRGVGDFLVLGIADVSDEYPDECSLTVTESKGNQERTDGT